MRTETIQLTLYKFEELSDQAKEKARDWYREGDDFQFDAEVVYNDASTIGKLMGIDLDTKPVKLMGGKTRHDPCIFYSGFWNQGDGACFEGTYRYQKGAVKAVANHTCNSDPELIRIAQGLQDVQKRHFYKLRARTTHRGHYYHSGCMSVEVYHYDDQYRDIGDAEDEITQLLRDFADWIYEQLEEAYEYRMSDEAVDAGILANEYEFDENGEIH